MLRPAIIDTDILSEVHRNKNFNVSRRVAVYLAIHGRLSISSITAHERIAGHVKARQHVQSDRFIEEMRQYEVLAFDSNAARIAGQIDGHLSLKGKPVGAFDSLIAATAICHGRAIVTGNTRHFQSITIVAESLGHTLEIHDWRAPIT